MITEFTQEVQATVKEYQEAGIRVNEWLLAEIEIAKIAAKEAEEV